MLTNLIEFCKTLKLYILFFKYVSKVTDANWTYGQNIENHATPVSATKRGLGRLKNKKCG